MAERGAGGVHVHVAQHSAAVEATGSVPEIDIRTPHTSAAAKGVAGVLALVAALGLVALASWHLGSPPQAVAVSPVPREAPLTRADVRELASEVAEVTAARLERITMERRDHDRELLGARLDAVDMQLRAIRGQVERIEAGR